MIWNALINTVSLKTIQQVMIIMICMGWLVLKSYQCVILLQLCPVGDHSTKTFPFTDCDLCVCDVLNKINCFVFPGELYTVPYMVCSTLMLSWDALFFNRWSPPKGPYPPCLCIADRALLAGYPRNAVLLSFGQWMYPLSNGFTFACY